MTFAATDYVRARLESAVRHCKSPEQFARELGSLSETLDESIWELLSLLELYFRRGQIPVAYFRPARTCVERVALGLPPREAPEPAVDSPPVELLQPSRSRLRMAVARGLFVSALCFVSVTLVWVLTVRHSAVPVLPPVTAVLKEKPVTAPPKEEPVAPPQAAVTAPSEEAVPEVAAATAAPPLETAPPAADTAPVHTAPRPATVKVDARLARQSSSQCTDALLRASLSARDTGTAPGACRSF
jgi:putative intracellular protease/amidase